MVYANVVTANCQELKGLTKGGAAKLPAKDANLPSQRMFVAITVQSSLP